MSDPDWLSYTGAITGVIGAVTGIAGAIMGYISYRHSGQLKSLDLRLELRRTEADLRSVAGDLPELLSRAKQSHLRVAAASGNVPSGALQFWSASWEADVAAVRSLEAELPDEGVDYASAKPSHLESKLVAVHSLSGRANTLRDKYLASLASDDKEREQIRAGLRDRG